MENKVKLVIAELEQVKEERARDNINFEAEKCELESKIDKYKGQCTELQSENEKLQSENEKLQSENEKLQIENKRLQKYLHDLESANKNAEEKSQINLYTTDLNSQMTKVNESTDDALDINSLPDEVTVEVFSYLQQNQLGQIARVCRRWNVLTKSPLLWRKVNVKIFSSNRSWTTVAKSFINGLPSCVTFIRLNFSKCKDLDFKELCVKLHQNCPHVEELILARCDIPTILPEVINLCTLFLQCVKKLVFLYCHFSKGSRTVELNDNSKIEVLDLYCCDISNFSKTQFSKLLYLKELRLNKTDVDDTWFEDDASFLNKLHVLDLGWTRITANTFLAIQRHGHNLKELYLCKVHLRGHDLNFNNFVCTHLKTICLTYFGTTCESVVSLIHSCPSLENVYVDERVAESFAAHPFAVANRCKTGIVKVIDLVHNHKTKKKLKLSTPETTSQPSNPPFICNKEVVIQLERLSDSFVAEMTADGSALPPEQVNESNDDALDINSLPNEIILEVFSYLEQNQLGQIARVCRRWNVFTKSPLLWKNVNVKISPSHGCQTSVAESFINGLPNFVTSIMLDFADSDDWIEPLDFAELCLRLKEKCPHLEELILINSRLSNSLPAVLGCTHLLQDVQKLIFKSTSFLYDRSIDESFGMSKVKILELHDCYFHSYNGSPFSKLPRLKQLHLYGTFVPDVLDSWFEDDVSFLNQLHVLNVGRTLINSSIFSTIQNHCHNLKELYLCSSFIRDLNLNFNKSVFPQLKTICLSCYHITCEGVVSLIQSCPSLENVYVSEYVAVTFAAHPFVDGNRCKLGIVKAIGHNHIHNVDYSHT